MKKLLSVLCVLILLVMWSALFIGLAPHTTAQELVATDSTQWLGWITFNGEYSGIDPGFYGDDPPPTQYYRKDVEIGLRSDGVVVWRKIKK